MTKIKLAIITGASGGLGRALVKEFAVHGWKVIGTGRSERQADLAEEADYSRFDASDAQACEMFWEQIYDGHSEDQICLVNNAGGYIGGGLLKATPEDYEQQMRSCYFSSVYMTRGMALVYPKARIINVVSSSALQAHKNNSAYGAAKAAQMHFFQSLQEEFEPAQYQITNLYPSNIASKGPDDNAMTTEDLATFVHEQAKNSKTYYLRDVTIYPLPAAAQNN